MPHIEDYPALADTDLVTSDVFYARRPGAAQGSRDFKFSFSSILVALIAAANGPAARAAVGFLTATAALDFPSIGAGAQSDLTISVPGAAVGDAVFLGMPSAPVAGLVFNGFVSAADTVKIRASNISSGSVDETSMTFRAVVIKST